MGLGAMVKQRKKWGQSDSTAGRTFDLYAIDPNS